MANSNASDLRKLAAYFFLITSTTGFLQPFLPLYMSASGIHRNQIGLIIGLGTGLAMIVQPTLGRLSDRLDARRPIIAICALVCAGSYFCLPLVSGFGPILCLVALGANGTMYLNAVGGVLVGRLVPSLGGGAAYGNVRLWGSIGYIVVSLATGIVLSLRAGSGLDRSALDPIFRFGPILFLSIGLLAYFLPDRPSSLTRSPESSKAPLPPNLKRFLAAYFFYNVALYGASGFLSLYLQSLGASALGITMTFVAGVIVEVLVMRWSGRFSDRFGRRPTLAISFILLPIRMVMYIPAKGAAWVAAVQSLHGFNFGIMGAISVAFANDLALDENRGHAQARLFAVQGIATALGPIMLGVAAESESLRSVFGWAALSAAIGAVIFLLGVDDSHPSSESLADKAPHAIRPLLRWLDTPRYRV